MNNNFDMFCTTPLPTTWVTAGVPSCLRRSKDMNGEEKPAKRVLFADNKQTFEKGFKCESCHNPFHAGRKLVCANEACSAWLCHGCKLDNGLCQDCTACIENTVEDTVIAALLSHPEDPQPDVSPVAISRTNSAISVDWDDYGKEWNRRGEPLWPIHSDGYTSDEMCHCARSNCMYGEAAAHERGAVIDAMIDASKPPVIARTKVCRTLAGPLVRFRVRPFRKRIGRPHLHNHIRGSFKTIHACEGAPLHIKGRIFVGYSPDYGNPIKFKIALFRGGAPVPLR